jgi:small conductance mechanosensitive channel
MNDAVASGQRPPAAVALEVLDAVSTRAEAGLCSEAVVIEEQTRPAQPLQPGENLLPVAAEASTSAAASGVARGSR